MIYANPGHGEIEIYEKIECVKSLWECAAHAYGACQLREKKYRPLHIFFRPRRTHTKQHEDGPPGSERGCSRPLVPRLVLAVPRAGGLRPLADPALVVAATTAGVTPAPRAPLRAEPALVRAALRLSALGRRTRRLYDVRAVLAVGNVDCEGARDAGAR